MHSRIAGTGSYLPAQVVTNHDLERRIDTTDAWIRTRTGIRERRIAAPAEMTSDLAEHAARAALAAAAITPADVDLIIVATTTPDIVFPSTACILQAKLGARGGPAFDVQAVCTGFVYALAIADRMVAGGMARNAVVVGAEIYSRILDWNDRGTCVLFGDGAGAVVLLPSRVPGIMSAHLHADGACRDILSVPGSLNAGAITGSPYVHMDGQAVFKLAVNVMTQVGNEALAANRVDVGAVDWLIPHQANLRIIDAVAKKLGVPRERVITTVDRHANTSAASIPLALDEGARDGRIAVGHRLLLIGVGGGFTWGSVFLTW
jgi:3-oxoacyl-[acyl-carrier-protein] synthase III